MRVVVNKKALANTLLDAMDVWIYDDVEIERAEHEGIYNVKVLFEYDKWPWVAEVNVKVQATPEIMDFNYTAIKAVLDITVRCGENNELTLFLSPKRDGKIAREFGLLAFWAVFHTYGFPEYEDELKKLWKGWVGKGT